MPKLYLLTNEDPLPLLLQKLDIIAGQGIVSMFQIRRKKTAIQALPFEIEQILNALHSYNIEVIVNDNVTLAKAFGLGVHLGQSDGAIADARAVLGKTATIGRTCHASLDLLGQAHKDGASYGAVGAVFGSVTKPNASPMLFSDNDLIGLKSLKNQGFPLCVIGGIGLDNMGQVADKLGGVVPDYVAVSNDIIGKSVDELGRHCERWGNLLAEF